MGQRLQRVHSSSRTVKRLETRRLEKPGPVALQFNRSRLTRETLARIPPLPFVPFERAILAYAPNPWC